MFNYVYNVCLSLCGHMQMSVGTYRIQNSTLNSLKLELQRVKSHVMWVPGTKLCPLQEQDVI